MVLVSSANNKKRVCLPFLTGKKPSKINLSFGKPELTKAGTKAVAPGKQSTSILFSTQALVSKKPGSDIAGVPASEIKAQVSPFFILFKIPVIDLCSLCM